MECPCKYNAAYMLPLQGGCFFLLQDVERAWRRADETVRVASWGSGSSKTRRSWGQHGEDARLDSWSD